LNWVVILIAVVLLAIVAWAIMQSKGKYLLTGAALPPILPLLIANRQPQVVPQRKINRIPLMLQTIISRILLKKK